MSKNEKCGIIDKMGIMEIENIVIERERLNRLSEVLCHVVVNCLTQRESALFMALYDGKTQVGIAKEWEITLQAVNLLFLSMKEKIKIMLVKYGFEEYTKE